METDPQKRGPMVPLMCFSSCPLGIFLSFSLDPSSIPFLEAGQLLVNFHDDGSIQIIPTPVMGIQEKLLVDRAQREHNPQALS